MTKWRRPKLDYMRSAKKRQRGDSPAHYLSASRKFCCSLSPSFWTTFQFFLFFQDCFLNVALNGDHPYEAAKKWRSYLGIFRQIWLSTSTMKYKYLINLLYLWLDTEKPNIEIWRFFFFFFLLLLPIKTLQNHLIFFHLFD
jgi:hypothetical protein